MMANSEGNNEAISEETESKILCFSKEMLPCKLLVLTIEVSVTCAFSYHMLFLKSAGLTMTQVGLITGIVGLCTFPATTVWGGFIDSVTKYRAFLYTSLSVTTALVTCFIPWPLKFVAITKTLDTCFDNTTSHNRSLLLANGFNCSTTLHLQNSNTVFIVMTSYGLVTNWLSSGLTCFVEGSIVKAVFLSKTEQSYGKQKVFSAVGTAVGNFIAGVAIDQLKPKYLPQFSVPYFVSTPFFLLLIPLLYLVTRRTRKAGNTTETSEEKVAVTKQVLKVFRECHNSIFLMSVFLAGISFTISTDFVNVFMYDVMNPTKTLISLTAAVGNLSQLIVYPFTSMLIKLFGGPIRCITFSVFIYSLRLVLISFAPSPWYILAIQLLHGLCYSLSWAAMVEQVWVIFPQEVKNTAIGILISVHTGAAFMTGSLLGGYIYHKYQGYGLFRGMAMVNLMWGIFMIIYFEIKRKRAKSVDRSCPNAIGVINEIDIQD